MLVKLGIRLEVLDRPECIWHINGRIFMLMTSRCAFSKGVFSFCSTDRGFKCALGQSKARGYWALGSYRFLTRLCHKSSNDFKIGELCFIMNVINKHIR